MNIKKIIPILEWLPNYNKSLFKDDLVAGVTVGQNLELTGNVLSSTATGSAYYFVATISLPGGTSGQDYNNLNLDLLGGNISKTLFRLTDRTAGYNITGISGGTDGRHIVLFNVSTSNLKIYDEDTRSLANNRIITLNNGFVNTSGQGTAELVYDGSLNRWILIGFRD